MRSRSLLFLAACLAVLFWSFALSAAEKPAQLTLSCDLPGHLAKTGQEVTVNLHLSQDGGALADAPLLWLIEGHASVFGYRRGKTDASGNLTIRTKLDRPGFLRILAVYKSGKPGEKEIQKRIGIAVDPEKIVSARPKPADFDAYWDGEIAAMKKMPLRAEVSRVEVANPNYRERVDMYDVKINTPGDRPFVYGYLCIPKNAAPKSLPIMMSYQGAGFRSSVQTLFLASLGRMVLDINAHGLPNGKSREFYAEADRKNSDYRYRGCDRRDTIYFRSMILRAVRALQYMKSRPEWDGRTILVSGGSQGGGQALAVAGLDPDVTFCFAGVPALADHGGVLAGRQSGWPQILKTAERGGFPAKPEACDYVDAVFFASRIKHAECLLSVGFFDFVCAPDSVYAAYNAIPSKNKKIIHDVNSDHTMPLATHLAGQKAGTEHIRTAASGR